MLNGVPLQGACLYAVPTGLLVLAWVKLEKQ